MLSRWAAAVVVVTFFGVGCNDNNAGSDLGVRRDGPRGDGVGPIGDGGTRPEAGGGPGSYSFLLSGDQMAPRVQSAGSGIATVTVSPDKSQIDVSVTVSNLGGLTGAEIHVGEVGARGPAIFVLSTLAFTNPLQVTLRAGDLKPQASSGVSTFADALNVIASGMAYLVVKTNNGQDGELRGQMGVVTLDGTLSADQLQPAVTSNAAGTVKAVVAGDQKSVEVTLTPADVTGSTGAFIYAGTAGQNGPVIFKITTQPLTGPVTVTLGAADVTPQPSQNIITFADAIDAMLAGMTYVQINTSIHPSGETRGHIGRITLNANLTGQQMVPPVTTTDNANAQVTVPNSRKQIDVYLNANAIKNITGVSINVAPTGESGPAIFQVTGASFENILDKVLLPSDLQLQSGNGIASFADAIRALLTGKAYLILFTTDHSSGFLRGQIGQ